MAPTFEREFEVPDIEQETVDSVDPLYAAGPEFVRDFTRGAIVAIPALLSLLAVSQLAFARGARKEIVQRDRGTCQSPECVGYLYDEGHCPRSMDLESQNGGWMVTVAHWPDQHLPHVDDRVDAGRCLCTCCHVIEEVRRGNYNGAKKLYRSTTHRSNAWMRINRSRDRRISFGALCKLAESRGSIQTQKPKKQKQKSNGRNERSRFRTSWR